MRFYHDGSHNRVPTVNHPTLGPAVRVPPMFWQTDPITNAKIPAFMACPPDALAFSIPGVGTFVVKRGESVDLPVPERMSVASLKNMAPQLLTEEEARAAGVLDAKKPSAR